MRLILQEAILVHAEASKYSWPYRNCQKCYESREYDRFGYW